MRRGLVFMICLSVIALFGCKSQQEKSIESENFELVKLGDGVYSGIHKFGGKAICNVGIVDNGNETIIFDTFLSPDVATELIETVNNLDLSPIKYVVNSHSHNDHIRGNQVFPEDIKIISTTRTGELIEKWEPLDIAEEKKYAPQRLAYYDSLYQTFSGDKTSREYQQILMWKPYYEILANSHLEVKTRLPDIFVDSVQQFDGPDRKITLISKGAGHTESDLIMYLADDKVVFSGDLVFNSCHPYVPHGNISKWKLWLDFINTLNPETVIPGHGEIGTHELIDQMKNYLLDLENSAQIMIDENRSLEHIDSISPPHKYKDWWFDRFYASNLRFAYESRISKITE
ncbi:MAG: MBL fold metallo-hydrolase [Flavobacteriaceae bacterium]|nr:MBL fold metallo-hydrolase [Flavobacteriaceae bacterium]